jgi:hypothetical protein
MSDNPLREGDVVGRFRRGLMIDIGTVGAGETIRWTRKVEPKAGDQVERIPA